MSHITAAARPAPDTDAHMPGWYMERARTLIADHAELFRPPVIRHAQRSISAAPARPARQKSPQLRLPLRPTMRR